MHEKGYAHRDLKPENLLLSEDFNLKLADFGFATLLAGKGNNGRLKTILGTESYMAPEIHMKASYYHGILVDLFAAGILLFIFYTGRPPFNSAKPRDTFYNMICTNKHERFWAQQCKMSKDPNMFSDEFKSLVSAMLAFDPTQRPSIAEIISHPWFNGPTATHEQVVQEFQNRKNKVQEVLKQEREALEKKKEKMKELQAKNAGNKMPMHNFGPMFRGKGPVRDVGDDTTEDVGSEDMKLWNEIENKMND